MKEDIKSLHKAALKLCKWVITVVSEDKIADLVKLVIPQILGFKLKKDSIVYVK